MTDYDEGDNCPKCKQGMLVIMGPDDCGNNFIKCQDCNYDATEEEKEE